MVVLLLLSEKYLFAFEMRNPSWYVQDVIYLFKKFNFALCIHDFTRDLLLEQITTNFIYVRSHGPVSLYYGKYSSKHLNQWAEKINQWLKQKFNIFAYLNSDARDWAVENALEIKNHINWG